MHILRPNEMWFLEIKDKNTGHAPALEECEGNGNNKDSKPAGM